MTHALSRDSAPFRRPAPADREHCQGDEAVVEEFVPLSRAEAQALRARLPMLSPWRVIAVQAAAGALCVAVAGAASGSAALAASALYGAAAVVLPQVVLARGVSRVQGGNPVAAAFGFLVWELAKIGLAVAMLAAAGRVISHPSWPALLVTMVVCMKASWLALLWQRRPASRTTNSATRG
jgi:ATP synthase protein I